MKITVFFLTALTAAIMMGCSNPVYVQKDESANLAKYRTYMWVATKANEDDHRDVTAFAGQAIRQSAKDELLKRGWTEVTDNPDVLMSYDILVERTTQQQSSPVYSQPFTRVYYNPYSRRWGTVYYPSQFVGYDSYEVPVKEGTVTITMIDPRTDKALWQGWTTGQMNHGKFTNEEISKDVRKIFKKFKVE